MPVWGRVVASKVSRNLECASDTNHVTRGGPVSDTLRGRVPVVSHLTGLTGSYRFSNVLARIVLARIHPVVHRPGRARSWGGTRSSWASLRFVGQNAEFLGKKTVLATSQANPLRDGVVQTDPLPALPFCR